MNITRGKTLLTLKYSCCEKPKLLQKSMLWKAKITAKIKAVLDLFKFRKGKVITHDTSSLSLMAHSGGKFFLLSMNSSSNNSNNSMWYQIFALINLFRNKIN